MHITTRLGRAAFAAVLALGMAAAPVAAATLAQNTANSQLAGTTAYYGQSFTVSVAGDAANQTYTGVSFNFFNSGLASAAGNFYLFTQAYAGSANSLSTNASGAMGYVGAGAASGGVYTFNPLLTLTNNTQYFGYSDASVSASGASAPSGGPYSGGIEYTSSSGGNNSFSGFANFDLAFNVAGTAVSAVAGVPEPASWTLMIAGFGLAGAALRRRRIAPASVTART